MKPWKLVKWISVKTATIRAVVISAGKLVKWISVKTATIRAVVISAVNFFQAFMLMRSSFMPIKKRIIAAAVKYDTLCM